MFFIRAMVQIFSFVERTFHLSTYEHIPTIALINTHYLYTISTSLPKFLATEVGKLESHQCKTKTDSYCLY